MKILPVMQKVVEKIMADESELMEFLQTLKNGAKEALRIYFAPLLVSAFLFPVIVVVLFAAMDFTALRDLFLTGKPSSIESWFQVMIAIGVILGACYLMFRQHADEEREHERVISEIKSREAELAVGEGRRLAAKEVTMGRCVPNAAAHWEMEDLAKRLKGAKEGSDILDRRVLVALNIVGTSLRPTQSEEDAKALLKLRYSGMPSNYEWAVERRAYSAILIWVREAEGRRWVNSAFERGHTAALTITRCVLLREMAVYTEL